MLLWCSMTWQTFIKFCGDWGIRDFVKSTKLNLSLGWGGGNFRCIISKLIIQKSRLGIHCEFVLWCMMRENLANEMSMLVYEITWYCHAPSHHMNQYLPISITPYGVSKPRLDDVRNYLVKLISIPWWLTSDKIILLQRVPPLAKVWDILEESV